MMTRLLITAALMMQLGCAETTAKTRAPAAEDSTAAEAAVVAAGYTKVKMGSHVSLLLSPCSKEDSWFASYDFTAVAPNSRRVAGHACCGLVFRGCTIRF